MIINNFHIYAGQASINYVHHAMRIFILKLKLLQDSNEYKIQMPGNSAVGFVLKAKLHSLNQHEQFLNLMLLALLNKEEGTLYLLVSQNL